MVVSQKDQRVTPDVLEACRRGDRDAFHLVYEAHKDTVYSMALYFFRGDAATAADVTQQVFLRLMDKIGQFKAQSEFSTWLHRMVANICIDRTRNSWGRATMVDPAVLEARATEGTHEQVLEQRELRRTIHAALAALTPKIRMAIVLRYFEDLSYGEMATVLNCSIGTVASRLSKGHAILSQRLAILGRKGDR
jgi:RNA polymerase sigma-70 factor (ECF subfamily)